MAEYWHVIVYSLVGGVFSLLGGVLLLSRKQLAVALAKYAAPFAAGALLSAVFLDLLAEAVHESHTDGLFAATLAGVVLFFIGERFLRWFHHHHVRGEQDATLSLVVIGDTIHNALDGVAIAAAFLVSVPTGIVTALVVAAHEIPHEVGDFGLMLHKGMRRGHVLLVNTASSVVTTVAAIITFAIGSTDVLPLGALIGVSAGFLLYIALSDIVPEIHEHTPDHRLVSWQPLLLLLGVGVVALVVQLARHFVE